MGAAFAPNLCALINRRQPAGRPIANAVHGQSARVAQDDVGRQILSLGAESINDPGTPSRPPGLELSHCG